MLKELTRKHKTPGLHYEVVQVTPEVAKSWLDTNTRNRKPSYRAVDKYARDMASGAWKITGDPVRFDANGLLIDGQHRLMACVKADVPFLTCVVYGLPTETQNVIDTGKARTAADVLTIEGRAHAQAVAGIARTLLDIKHDQVLARRTVWTIAEIMACLDRHPGIHNAASRVWAARIPRGISKTYLSTVFFVGSYLQNDRDTADAFVSVFSSGVPAYDGCAAHYARERILRSIGSHGAGDGRPAALFGLSDAWNSFRRQTPIKRQVPWSKRAPEFDGVDVSQL